MARLEDRNTRLRALVTQIALEWPGDDVTDVLLAALLLTASPGLVVTVQEMEHWRDEADD